MDNVYGLLPYAEYPDLLTVENCVFDSNYQHIRNRSKAYVYRSTAFLRASTDNITKTQILSPSTVQLIRLQ